MGCGGSKNEIKESSVQKEKHRKQHLDSNKDENKPDLNQGSHEELKDERNQSHSVAQQEKNLNAIDKQHKDKENDEKVEEKVEIINEVKIEQGSSEKSFKGNKFEKESQELEKDKDPNSAKDKKSVDSAIRRNGDAGSGNGDWHQHESREKPINSANGTKVEDNKEENKYNNGEVDCDGKEIKSGKKSEKTDKSEKISEREKNSKLEDSSKSSERVGDSPKFPDAGHNEPLDPVSINKIESNSSPKSKKSSRSNSPPSFSASKLNTISDPSKVENS